MCGAARAPYSDARLPAQMRARLSQAAHPRRPVLVPARTPPPVRAHARQRTCMCVSEERRSPELRDVTRLAPVRPSRAAEFTSQQRT